LCSTLSCASLNGPIAVTLAAAPALANWSCLAHAM
jgi:hypothetical protein